MTGDGSREALPPLPDGDLYCHGATTVYGGEYFTAEQMRAYALAYGATLAAQVEALQSSLSQLYGAKFSDRCYHALKSRAEVAEGQVEALLEALRECRPFVSRDATDEHALGWVAIDLTRRIDHLANREATP